MQKFGSKPTESAKSLRIGGRYSFKTQKTPKDHPVIYRRGELEIDIDGLQSEGENSDLNAFNGKGDKQPQIKSSFSQSLKPSKNSKIGQTAPRTPISLQNARNLYKSHINRQPLAQKSQEKIEKVVGYENQERPIERSTKSRLDVLISKAKKHQLRSKEKSKNQSFREIKLFEKRSKSTVENSNQEPQNTSPGQVEVAEASKYSEKSYCLMRSQEKRKRSKKYVRNAYKSRKSETQSKENKRRSNKRPATKKSSSQRMNLSRQGSRLKKRKGTLDMSNTKHQGSNRPKNGHKRIKSSSLSSLKGIENSTKPKRLRKDRGASSTTENVGKQSRETREGKSAKENSYSNKIPKSKSKNSFGFTDQTKSKNGTKRGYSPKIDGLYSQFKTECSRLIAKTQDEQYCSNSQFTNSLKKYMSEGTSGSTNAKELQSYDLIKSKKSYPDQLNETGGGGKFSVLEKISQNQQRHYKTDLMLKTRRKFKKRTKSGADAVENQWSTRELAGGSNTSYGQLGGRKGESLLLTTGGGTNPSLFQQNPVDYGNYKGIGSLSKNGNSRKLFFSQTQLLRASGLKKSGGFGGGCISANTVSSVKNSVNVASNNSPIFGNHPKTEDSGIEHSIGYEGKISSVLAQSEILERARKDPGSNKEREYTQNIFQKIKGKKGSRSRRRASGNSLGAGKGGGGPEGFSSMEKNTVEKIEEILAGKGKVEFGNEKKMSRSGVGVAKVSEEVAKNLSPMLMDRFNKFHYKLKSKPKTSKRRAPISILESLKDSIRHTEDNYLKKGENSSFANEAVEAAIMPSETVGTSLMSQEVTELTAELKKMNLSEQRVEKFRNIFLPYLDFTFSLEQENKELKQFLVSREAHIQELEQKLSKNSKKLKKEKELLQKKTQQMVKNERDLRIEIEKEFNLIKNQAEEMKKQNKILNDVLKGFCHEKESLDLERARSRAGGMVGAGSEVKQSKDTSQRSWGQDLVDSEVGKTPVNSGKATSLQDQEHLRQALLETEVQLRKAKEELEDLKVG